MFTKEYMTDRCSEIAKIMAGVQNEQTNQKLRDNIVSAEIGSFMRGGTGKIKSNLNCPYLSLKTLFSLTYQAGHICIIFCLMQVQLCFSA